MLRDLVLPNLAGAAIVAVRSSLDCQPEAGRLAKWLVQALVRGCAVQATERTV